MTSAKITELSAAAFGAITQTKQSTPDGAPNFSDFMAKESTVPQTLDTEKNSVSQTDARAAYEKSDKKGCEKLAKDSDSPQEKVTETKAGDTEVTDKVEEVTDDVTKKLAEELGVSEEEIKEAMEVLGLTVVDLMSQGNMAQLIAKVTNVESVEIVTDDSLFSQMENLTAEVTDALSQAADMLGMDLEEVVACVEQPMESMQSVETQGFVKEEVLSQQADQNTAEEPAARETETKVEISVDDQVSAEQTDGNEQKTQNATANNGNASDRQQANGQEHKDDAGKTETSHIGNTQNAVNMQEVPNAVNPLEQNVETADYPEMTEMPRTQEIIDQIAEHVSIHRSEQITEMEIALNPASLGNIHLHVESKAGTVSAQLIAQDQAVAAALESQLALLKESLEAQGMRVDAVEVTVASHAFEQNLDQQGKEKEEEAKNSAKHRQRRILDLDAVDAQAEAAGELTQAERLQMEMMRMGGNRMNFQV